MIRELFIDPLTDPTFQRALLGGSLIAIVCGVIGAYIILRRMAFLGDALSHAMLAGVTTGFLVMKIFFGRDAHSPAMLVGSMLAGLFTVMSINFVSRISRIKEDTAIGIMYTGIFAAGGLLASYFSRLIDIDIYHFVMGQVLSISDGELLLMGIVSGGVIASVILFYRQLQITSFDPVMAASLGISVAGIDHLLTACTSLVVVSAVPLVGVILVVGMLVTPAATAYLLCDRLSRMQMLAALFGLSSVVGGLFVSHWIGDVSSEPMIVFFSTVQFLCVLVIAPRYGILADWIRRRSRVAQDLVEDILGCFRKGHHQPISRATVHQFVDARPDEIRKAIRWCDRHDWIEIDGDTLLLTEEGQREAKRLLRAHRLWETYLEQLGTPSDQLHEKAHLLEHVHDERTVAYLDDKLGHPLLDPHGAEIPLDVVNVAPGGISKISLLRDGQSGTIQRIDGKLKGITLTIGGHVQVGPREEEGKVWTMRLADGRWVELDHGAADCVFIRLDPENGQ